MTDGERLAYKDFNDKLLALNEQTLNFLCESFSAVNCDKHNTPCDKCPLCLSGNCVLFLFEVEKYGRLAERR